MLALLGVPTLMLNAQPAAALVALSAAMVFVGVVLESVGLWRHASDMNLANNEGSASHYIQSTVFGKSYALRNTLLGVNLLLAAALFIWPEPTLLSAAVGVALLLTAAMVAIIGRTLFYVLVVPTTMPGAFFWKNKDFEEHAREIGLAHMPQVGVVYDHH